MKSVANKSKYRYRQIAEMIQRDISNRYKYGELIASEQLLAKKYAVSCVTLRQALGYLAQRGFVRRHHGRGTVVVDRTATGELAILVRPSLLGVGASPYYYLVRSYLFEYLRQKKVSLNIKIHAGEMTTSGEDWPLTLDLLEPEVLGRIRGVFSFHKLGEVEAKLEDAGVPVLYLSNVGGKNQYHVYFKDDALEKGVKYLAQRGCQSVGVIWSGEVKGREENYEKRCREFELLANNMGLKTRREWIMGRRGSAGIGVTERDGYELFVELWNQNERPECIFVNDDILCRGVLRGTLHLGVKIPAQLCLVTMANKGIEFPYHLALTRIEYDAAELARIAADMMLSLIQGDTVELKNICIPGELVQGATG